jgi:hypothetical protein
MEIKQMMARMLAEMKAEITNQAKAGTNIKEIRAGKELLKEEMLAKMDANLKVNNRNEVLTRRD